MKSCRACDVILCLRFMKTHIKLNQLYLDQSTVNDITVVHPLCNFELNALHM